MKGCAVLVITADQNNNVIDITVTVSRLKLNFYYNQLISGQVSFSSLYLYLTLIVFQLVEMQSTSVSSNITPSRVATSAADSSTKQRRSVVKKRTTFKRKIYGFVLFQDELEEWGRQQFGYTDDEKVLESYINKTISYLFRGSYRLWRRTSIHFVSCNTGPHRHESDFCLTLADNLSSDTATLPPREVIDMIKKNLRIEKDPQWYRFDGD